MPRSGTSGIWRGSTGDSSAEKCNIIRYTWDRRVSLGLRKLGGAIVRPGKGEGLSQGVFDFGEVEGAVEFRLEGGDAALLGSDAARYDAREGGEVGIHVEGEAVVGHPTAHGHTDGGDFSRADPDSRHALAAGGDEAEGSDGFDQDLFE